MAAILVNGHQLARDSKDRKRSVKTLLQAKITKITNADLRNKLMNACKAADEGDAGLAASSLYNALARNGWQSSLWVYFRTVVPAMSICLEIMNLAVTALHGL